MQPHFGHTGWPSVEAQRIDLKVSNAWSLDWRMTLDSDSVRAAIERRKCWAKRITPRVSFTGECLILLRQKRSEPECRSLDQPLRIPARSDPWCACYLMPENSHQPFRRRERAMERFRRMKTLQKFAAVHGTVHNHYNQERHLISRDLYRERRSAALAEWRAVMG